MKLNFKVKNLCTRNLYKSKSTEFENLSTAQTQMPFVFLDLEKEQKQRINKLVEFTNQLLLLCLV